jgi:hypothetical protein
LGLGKKQYPFESQVMNGSRLLTRFYKDYSYKGGGWQPFDGRWSKRKANLTTDLRIQSFK